LTVSEEKLPDRLRKSSLTGGAAAVLAVLAALGLAGCGSSSGEPILTVYLSAPRSGPVAGDGRDVAEGARRALEDAGAEAGGQTVKLEVLDDAGPAGATGAHAGANARTATGDSTAIAYIGELDSGTTRTSLPITNEAGLLQVSPGASAVDLTRVAPGSDEVPDATQPSGVRTFGRVIPSDTAQGAAAAGVTADRGIERVRTVGSGGAYGEALRSGFESVDRAPAIIHSGPADALYVVAASFVDIRATGPIFGADAQIFGSPPDTVLPPRAIIVSGTQAPSQLPGGEPAGLGRHPGRFAAYGYEAMAVVLDSIDRAGDPLDRGSVVDAFFATSDRDSVLGRYSIDEVGDTTLDRVGAYETTGDGLRPLPKPIAVP
jgi:branched-chain amino acid transport system substrate-binding protein